MKKKKYRFDIVEDCNESVSMREGKKEANSVAVNVYMKTH